MLCEAFVYQPSEAYIKHNAEAYAEIQVYPSWFIEFHSRVSGNVNPSMAMDGGVKLPQSPFLPITQTTRSAAKIPFATFPKYVFARYGASLDFL